MTRLLRNNSDRRTLLWSLVLFPTPLLMAFYYPQVTMWFLPLWLYLAVCAGVLSHYHNHRSVFHSRRLNRLYSVWLSIFYGFPVFSWIPTHNLNHHRYQNGRGDATSTARLGGRDNLLRLIYYPTLSSRFQAPEVKRYLLGLRSRRSPLYGWALAQCVAVPLVHLACLTAYVGVLGTPKGLLVYTVVLMIPALFAPWSMMVINYLQHIDCDPSSPDNHSRNFVGLAQNWLVFDAGLHTVHHEHPGVHFSEYRALHEQRKDKIAPHLKQDDVISFVVRRYLLRQRTVEHAQPS